MEKAYMKTIFECEKHFQKQHGFFAQKTLTSRGIEKALHEQTESCF